MKKLIGFEVKNGAGWKNICHAPCDSEDPAKGHHAK
jgi:hypothetical protein